MATNMLRGTVTSASGVAGSSCQVLIDGAATPVTAQGLAGYTPAVGDRLIVASVGKLLEIFVAPPSSGTGPDVTSLTLQAYGDASGVTLVTHGWAPGAVLDYFVNGVLAHETQGQATYAMVVHLTEDGAGAALSANTTYSFTVEQHGKPETLSPVATATLNMGVSPSFVTNEIEAASIYGGQIYGGTITSTNISGVNITGVNFQTTTNANQGIKIDGSGFRAYDGSGDEVINLDSSGGTITGTTYRTSASGTRLEINPALPGVEAIQFYDGSGNNTGVVAGGGTSSAVGVSIVAGSAINISDNSTFGSGIDFDPGSANLYVKHSGSTVSNLSMSSDGSMNVSAANVYLSGGSSTLNMTSSSVELGCSGSSNLTITSGSGNVTLDVSPISTASIYMKTAEAFNVQNQSSTDLLTVHADGSTYAYHANTTSASSVGQIASGGQILRSSSTRDSKLAIETMDPKHIKDLLSLNVSTWFDRVAAEGHAEMLAGKKDYTDNSTPLLRIPGLIAEEVEAVAKEFVVYDDTGKTLTTVAYDRVGVAWIPLVKELFDRIEALESKK